MADFFAFLGNHYLLVGLFLALLAAFFWNESTRAGATVSAQQLINLVNRQNALVFDLRERKEFEAGHIVDAINVPHQTIQDKVEALQKKYVDRPIILACKMGQHSSAAGNVLRKAGFAQVLRLTGGMTEWRNQNLPVVKGK